MRYRLLGESSTLIPMALVLAILDMVSNVGGGYWFRLKLILFGNIIGNNFKVPVTIIIIYKSRASARTPLLALL